MLFCEYDYFFKLQRDELTGCLSIDDLHISLLVMNRLNKTEFAFFSFL